MRTAARRRIEEEIEVLSKEVHELRCRRGLGPPDVEVLVNFLVAAFGRERAYEVTEAIDARGAQALTEALRALPLAPAAEPLRAAVIAAWETEDIAGFRRASAPLREALAALLEVRAQKWRYRTQARECYQSGWQQAPDLVEHVRSRVPQLNRWSLLVWAGRALGCAVEDVWRWQLWQAGWREYREAEQAREQQTSHSEEAWQREVAEHTLPQEEAAIVDCWPIPPDEQWPDQNTRERTLPRLRAWQAERAAQARPPAPEAGETRVE